MSSSALPFLSSRWNSDSDCAIYGYNIYDDDRVNVKGKALPLMNADDADLQGISKSIYRNGRKGRNRKEE